MRALSIPQPWAQLVIRGVKTVEIRSWPAKHKGGRIAIHASANLELKKVEALWADDRALAECFADQGWVDRDDLRDLPRSAIIGSVELRGVHPATAVRAAKIDPSTTNWIEDALETAVRDPTTGHLRPGPAPARTIPVRIPAGQYVFGFARALAVEPITGVGGQQHLWALPTDVAAELSAREARARSGAWTFPEASADRVRLARDAWRERFETEERRYSMKLIKEALDEYANREFPLDDEDAERMLKAEVRKLSEERGARGPDGRAWLRVPKTLRALFAGEARVAATRFEADLRILIHRSLQKQEYDTAYTKLYEDTVTRVREGLARGDQGASSRSEFEAEVKRMYISEWRKAEEEIAREDRVTHVPDY